MQHPLGSPAQQNLGIRVGEVSVTNKVLALPRSVKRAIALSADALLCAASVHLAYYLRTSEWPDLFGPIFYPTIAAALIALPLFVVFGLYRAIFRYAGGGSTYRDFAGGFGFCHPLCSNLHICQRRAREALLIASSTSVTPRCSTRRNRSSGA